MRYRSSVLVLSALISFSALLPSSPALAENASDIPDLRFVVRPASLDLRSGNIAVRIRVTCTQTVPAVGTASWYARAVQHVTAKGSAVITCDGVPHRSTIVLDPRNGRFHPGNVGLDLQFVAWGSTTGIAEGRSYSTVV